MINRSARWGIELFAANRAGLVDTGTLALSSSKPEIGVGAWHRSSAFVYDLQVDVDNEFYANGVLVHNCKICEPLEGTRENVWRREAPNGPGLHPNCRCWLEWVQWEQSGG